MCTDPALDPQAGVTTGSSGICVKFKVIQRQRAQIKTPIRDSSVNHHSEILVKGRTWDRKSGGPRV